MVEEQSDDRPFCGLGIDIKRNRNSNWIILVFTFTVNVPYMTIFCRLFPAALTVETVALVPQPPWLWFAQSKAERDDAGSRAGITRAMDGDVTLSLCTGNGARGHRLPDRSVQARAVHLDSGLGHPLWGPRQ